jgi:hypothetical protein
MLVSRLPDLTLTSAYGVSVSGKARSALARVNLLHHRQHFLCKSLTLIKPVDLVANMAYVCLNLSGN